jgi:glycerol-3-phosphate acyltransferase PlsX
MRIAVDGMGGDFAPVEIVKGAVIAAGEYEVDIVLTGPESQLKRELSKYDCSSVNIDIVHTDEYLIEGEQPAFALRKKRNASITIATKLVKEGKADAVISAGPTGGVVASALQILGTIEGISRPVVGGTFLGFAPKTLMLDIGSNIDCKPEQLLDFALVGAVYAERMLDIKNPTVALLSVGAEEGKGNEQVKRSYALLKNSGLNFIGNVEGYDIPLGRANVIICDGFVGNIVVKFCESLGKTVDQWLKNTLKEKLPASDLKELSDSLLLATNLADANGGGPLWAVNGISCVAHGRSKATEIARGIGQAKLAVERDLVNSLKTELAIARAKLKEITA